MGDNEYENINNVIVEDKANQSKNDAEKKESRQAAPAVENSNNDIISLANQSKNDVEKKESRPSAPAVENSNDDMISLADVIIY